MTKYRILVVEDSPTQAERVRSVLEDAGYAVEQARNGRDALAQVRKDPPDLILSDVVMPEMDGFAFCNAVKATPATSRIPVVLLTSQRTPMDIIRGLERGADNFITKPFEDQQLLDRVARIFENLAHRRRGGLDMEVSVRVGGREIVLNADKQQMVELLFSTSEELSESNRRLEEARVELEEQARELERRVEERTRELRKAEARYRSLVEEIPAVVYTAAADEAERITYISPQVQAMLGRSPDDVVASGGLLRALHPEDRPRVAAEMASLHETGGPLSSEFRLLRPDGRVVWVSGSARVLRGHEGSPPFVQGFMLDVTARRQAEERLLESQKMEAIGQLAGGIAHDFNNLLGVIDGYATLLAKELAEHERARRRLDEIRKATSRAAGLTRQLLAFGRKQVLQPELLDLNDVLAGMEDMLRRVISEDIQIVTLFTDGLGPVRADRGQVEQVILNLAVNARDAMPGGGRLTLETANVEVAADASRGADDLRQGSWVSLSVTDTGVGMDSATMARIFEPFFTTKGKDKGTGLGLAMVYGIVKQSGGHVTVESEPGRGTTFTVYLPRVEAQRTTVTAATAAPEALGGFGETILLVEDAPSLRVMIKEILEEAGYQVLDCPDTDLALATAAQPDQPIDLLLTDVVMPRMSGRQLAHAVEALRTGIRVVYMSGYDDESAGHHPPMGQAARFVQKPFTTNQLLRQVRSALDAPPPEESVGRGRES